MTSTCAFSFFVGAALARPGARLPHGHSVAVLQVQTLYYSADHKLLDGSVLDGQAEVCGWDDDHIQFVQVHGTHQSRPGAGPRERKGDRRQAWHVSGRTQQKLGDQLLSLGPGHRIEVTVQPAPSFHSTCTDFTQWSEKGL